MGANVKRESLSKPTKRKEKLLLEQRFNNSSKNKHTSKCYKMLYYKIVNNALAKRFQACYNTTKLHNFDIFVDNLYQGLHRA